jgi:hypothetical protein
MARHIILRDLETDGGTQFEEAQLEDDGTLRITGHDTGRTVSQFFGGDITSYRWVYVVPPDRIQILLHELGGNDDDDILTALAAYHEQHSGRISSLLKNPPVSASFDNWHS